MTPQGMVLTAPRRFEQRGFEMPEIGDDDALLAVEACGLCGTDHEQYTGLLPNAHPFIPGHEVVGRVEQIGAAAAQRWGVAEGARVAVEVFKSCGSCGQCNSGTYRRCERHGVATMIGFTSADEPPGLGGGYATHLYLEPDSLLLPLPDLMDPVFATLFNPLGAGIRWGVTLPETGPGDAVVILGPGIRGLCAAAAARDAGAEFIMVTGVGPQDEARLALARDFGADVAVDIAQEDPNGTLRRVLGRKADIVVDVTAKAPAAFAQAVSLARPGGTIVLAGVRGKPEAPGLHPDHIVYKELRILGALGVDLPAYQQAITMLAAGRYPFEALPRRVAGFNDIEALLQSMAGEQAEPPPVHGVFVPDIGDR